jgi:hypothetical protein
MTSLHDQMNCIKRELTFRHRVYPRQVASGNMTAQAADYELTTMQAVLNTLKALAEAQPKAATPIKPVEGQLFLFRGV